MHIRYSTRRRNGKTYRYPQLVESYRRPTDGMPAHRVITSLKHLSETEIDNLKTALAASKKGKTVIIARAPTPKPSKPAANLQYLDVAVLLEIWRQCQLGALLDDLLPKHDAAVPPSAIVAALSIQRCVAPRSKLFAERWFPRTALPELLDVPPGSFNNTRLHRVLDGLDAAGTELMARLSRHTVKQQGAFASLFLDVTDTWFIGQGPELAQRAKTKEGFVRRKVGIVLLCSEQGYPVRWEVIRGKEGDKESMARMVGSISGLSWVGDCPVICDRAMGNTAQIRQLLATDVRFLTALTRGEFSSYTDAVPHQPFAGVVVEPNTGAKEMKRQVEKMGQLAKAAGMQRVDDKLYVLDLKVIERPDEGVVAAGGEPDMEAVDKVIEAVRLGRQVREAVAEGRADSVAAAGRRLGLGKGLTFKYRKLARLSEDIQLAVLDGKAQGVSIAELLELGKHAELDAQYEAFEALLSRAAARGNKPKRCPPEKITSQTEDRPVRVRAAVYFNPEMFLEQRRSAQRYVTEVEAFVSALNRRLLSPRSKMTKPKILAEIDRTLRHRNLVEAYRVDVTKRQEADSGSSRYVARLTLDDEQWARRRRYDGFSLLVAHPDLKQSAVELCHLYRAKDIVEKDFETIKSFVKLRPVRHRLDAKVRAHVTLCMLALMLERLLEQRLGHKQTAQATLEQLATCCLNRYRGEQSSAYSVTELDSDQDALLRTLRLRHLADDDEVADRITPR